MTWTAGTIIFIRRAFVRGLLKRYARKSGIVFRSGMRRMDFESIRTVREFDDAITAPSFGFKDAQAYYESAGAKKVVEQIRVPFLLITGRRTIRFVALRGDFARSGRGAESSDSLCGAGAWRALRICLATRWELKDFGQKRG